MTRREIEYKNYLGIATVTPANTHANKKSLGKIINALDQVLEQ